MPRLNTFTPIFMFGIIVGITTSIVFTWPFSQSVNETSNTFTHKPPNDTISAEINNISCPKCPKCLNITDTPPKTDPKPCNPKQICDDECKKQMASFLEREKIKLNLILEEKCPNYMREHEKESSKDQQKGNVNVCDEAEKSIQVGQYPSKCVSNISPPLDSNNMSVVFLATPMVLDGKLRIMDKIAMTSWRLLTPKPKVILFSRDSIVKEFCDEMGFEYSNVEVNEFGTPYMNDLYKRGEKLSNASIVAYLNADLVLFNDFMHALKAVQDKFGHEWFASGRRYDVPLAWNQNLGDGELLQDLYVQISASDALNNRLWEQGIRELACGATVTGSKFGHGTETDFFVWPHGLWTRHGQTVPPFLIGRYFWGEWHIKVAAEVIKVPTIDVSISSLVIHNKHKHVQWHEGDDNPEQAFNRRTADEYLADWNTGVTEIMTYGTEDIILKDNSGVLVAVAQAKQVNASPASHVCVVKKQ